MQTEVSQQRWTLTWGLWESEQPFGRENGMEDEFGTLEDCRAEVLRLDTRYRKCGERIRMANARSTTGEVHLNLHED